MHTIEQARRVRDNMGSEYVICRDQQHSCYRVLKLSDPRVGYELPRVE